MLLRTPLLPVERYLELGAGGRPGEDGGGDMGLPRAAADPRVRRALSVASPSLFERLARPPSGSAAVRRRRLAVLRYLIRMSTRPTPYGLNAGVSLAGWGERTDIELGDGDEVRARLDMGVVDALIGELESRLEVVRELALERHPLVSVRAGRAFLPERFADEGGAFEVSVRATRPVVRALELCAGGSTPFVELASAIGADFPDAGPARVEELVHTLVREGLLVTELRPPLTRGDPAMHILAVLDRLGAAGAERRRLAAAVAACDRWQQLHEQEGAERFTAVMDTARAVAPARADVPPVRVDLRRPLAGERIAHAVGEEAARAAELLLRLSPLHSGPVPLNTYRDRFVERYGPYAEVPVPELLDPDGGLGPVDFVSEGSGAPPPDEATRRRDRRLLEIASAALRDGRLAIQLDPMTIAELDTGPAPERTYPTMEVAVFVASPSRDAVDAGDFKLVVSPLLGSYGAGRIFGRFADLFDGPGERAAREAARREEASAPGRLWAELVYRPEQPSIANVTVRPLTRSHEIVLGVAPGVDPEHVLPVDELVVGVRDELFYLRWPDGAAYVEVCEGHMLNAKAAPAVGAFLALLRYAGRPVITAFAWGSAGQLPRLPRVESGRVVLSPAIWHAPLGETGLDTATPDRFAATLRSWRADWRMPRRVFAGEGDHRLLIDLDDPDQVELLRRLAASHEDGAEVFLQEAMPDVDSAWLPGPDGAFLAELAVPLARRSVTGDGSGDGGGPPAGLAIHPRAARMRAPGSEWLYAKLYTGGTAAEQLIGHALGTFAQDLLRGGVAQDWFFVRFRDPRSHLRLRFRGDPDSMAKELTPRLYAWASGLIDQGFCGSLAIETYERELERYGGERGAEVAEAVFGIDSRAACDLIRLDLNGATGVERELLCVLTLDRLLAGLCANRTDRLRWCAERVDSRHEVMSQWRENKRLLRTLLGSGGRELSPLLDRFVSELRPHGDRLAGLFASGEILWPRADDLYASFAHMHCNRMLGLDRDAERRVLGLLLRTLESLFRSPLR